MKRLLIALSVAAALAAAGGSALAQTGATWDSGRPQMTRQELQLLLGRLEETANSEVFPDDTRRKAREEAAMVRNRLEYGDIRVGDQIALVVEGEDSLSQTFTVRTGETVALPGLGEVALRGVLRSELETHLRDYVAKYVRDPVVRAESFVRVTVSGSVGTPGFFSVEPDRLLTDAIMRAGGPAGDADLNRIYIQRGSERIWEGAYLQQAIADGRTLDQLSLHAGDQIVVPARQPGFAGRLLPIWTGVLSSVALLVTILARN